MLRQIRLRRSLQQPIREKVPSTVHIKLMENSLAAQGSTSPHGMASSSGAEQQ